MADQNAKKPNKKQPFSSSGKSNNNSSNQTKPQRNPAQGQTRPQGGSAQKGQQGKPPDQVNTSQNGQQQKKVNAGRGNGQCLPAQSTSGIANSKTVGTTKTSHNQP